MRRPHPGEPLLSVLGEFAIDLLPVPDADAGPEGTAPHYVARPGGNALNVAVAAGRLGTPVHLLARLGTGPLAANLRRHAETAGVDVSGFIAAAEPVSLAVVGLAPDGSADYGFHVQGAADWQWTDEELSRVLPTGRRSCTSARSPAGRHRAPMPSPVSWRACTGSRADQRRPQHPPDARRRPGGRRRSATRAAVVRERLDRLVARADVVKVSAEDLDWLAGRPARLDWTTPRSSWAARGPALVLLTDGGITAAGRPAGPPAAAPARSRRWPSPTPSAPATRSPPGSSRACSRRGSPPAALEALPDEHCSRLLDDAALVAAINCTRVGADPPTRAELAAARASPATGQRSDVRLVGFEELSADRPAGPAARPPGRVLGRLGPGRRRGAGAARPGLLPPARRVRRGRADRRTTRMPATCSGGERRPPGRRPRRRRVFLASAATRPRPPADGPVRIPGRGVGLVPSGRRAARAILRRGAGAPARRPLALLPAMPVRARTGVLFTRSLPLCLSGGASTTASRVACRCRAPTGPAAGRRPAASAPPSRRRRRRTRSAARQPPGQLFQRLCAQAAARPAPPARSRPSGAAPGARRARPTVRPAPAPSAARRHALSRSSSSASSAGRPRPWSGSGCTASPWRRPAAAATDCMVLRRGPCSANARAAPAAGRPCPVHRIAGAGVRAREVGGAVPRHGGPAGMGSTSPAA